MKRIITSSLAVILLLCAAPAPEAKAHPGLRFGVTDDPDSLFVGFFYEAPVSRLGRRGWLTIEPGIDVGFGDIGNADYFTLRGTFNAHFVFLVDRTMQLYPLVGISAYYYNIQDCSGDGCDNLGVGANLGFGFQFDRFSFELWAGLGDEIPDITFLFGLSF